MSKKNYEVCVTAHAMVIVIGAKDEEQAIEWAKDELNVGLFSDFDCTTEEIDEDADLESYKRHADAVSEA